MPQCTHLLAPLFEPTGCHMVYRPLVVCVLCGSECWSQWSLDEALEGLRKRGVGPGLIRKVRECFQEEWA